MIEKKKILSEGVKERIKMGEAEQQVDSGNIKFLFNLASKLGIWEGPILPISESKDSSFQRLERLLENLV